MWSFLAMLKRAIGFKQTNAKQQSMPRISMLGIEWP